MTFAIVVGKTHWEAGDVEYTLKHTNGCIAMIALFSSAQCCVSFHFISLKGNGYPYIYDSREKSAATVIYTLLSLKTITITPSSTYQMLQPLTSSIS